MLVILSILDTGQSQDRVQSPRSLWILLCGVLAVCVATADLAGWLFHLHALVHPGWNAPAAVFSAALCLLFSALALLAPERIPRQARLVLSGLVVLIALLAVVENLAQINLGLDLPLLHSEFLPTSDAPGRMPLNLAVALLSVGTALVLSLFNASRTVLRLLPGLLALAFLLGVGGLWAYWRDMQWIYERADTPNALRMAPDAAALLMMLSAALWVQSRRRFGAPLREASEQALRGFRSLAVALVAIVLLGYMIALVVFQSLSLDLAAADLFRSLESRRSLIQQSLATASSRAQAAVFPQDFALPLRLFDKDPHNPRAVAQLYSASQSLAQRGLPAVAVEGADRGYLAMGGFISRPAAQLDIHGQTPARLLWADGYKLDLGIPVRDLAGLAGVIVVQQPLENLDGNALSSDSQTATTVAGICGPADGALSCFPPQSLAAGFTLIQASGDTLLPVHLATRNRQGTALGFDPQGNRVLVAYAPIAGTGLGVVLERRVSTLFAPVRTRLQMVNVWLAILLPASLWVVRKQFQKQASALKEMSALYSGSLVRLELSATPEFLTDSPRARIPVPSLDSVQLPPEPVPVRTAPPARDSFRASPEPLREPRHFEAKVAPTPVPPIATPAPGTPRTPQPALTPAVPASSNGSAALPVAAPAPAPAQPAAAALESVRPSARAAGPDANRSFSKSPAPPTTAATANTAATPKASAIRGEARAATASVFIPPIGPPAAHLTSGPRRTEIASPPAPATRAASTQPVRLRVVASIASELVPQPFHTERDAWGHPLTFEGYLEAVLFSLHPPTLPKPEVDEVVAEPEGLLAVEPATETEAEELQEHVPFEHHDASEPRTGASEPVSATTDDSPAKDPLSGNNDDAQYQEQNRPPRRRRTASAGPGFKVSRMMVFLTLTGAFAAGVAITTGILGRIEGDESELP